jgi:serine/threonine protein kinase
VPGETLAFVTDRAPADVDELEPGHVLGSYRIISLLREGGMGRVYVAEHTLLGRQVALKVLRPQYSANRYAVTRFFAEARAVNRISHENIVEITDFCENGDGHNYLIMELLKGQDVSDLLLKLGVVPVNRAVDIAIQVASALTVVHEGRIVHRDLKPDNIYLIDRPSRTGFVKLLDFGIAKLVDPDGEGIQLGTTAEGAIIGTPEYMSPEQATGDGVDHRSDVYSLGVILYEMVTGVVPFRAANFGELVVQLLTVEPPAPSSHELPHELPSALEQLILHMLAKHANDRPQSMRDVEDRLRAIQADLMPLIADPVSARLRRATDRTPTIATKELPPKRKRTALFLTGAFACAALASAGWYILPDSQPAVPALALPAPQPAVAPMPPPAPPDDVAIQFRSTPPGATVRATGTNEVLGVTPFAYHVKRDNEVRSFTFELAAYTSSTQDVAISSDGAIAVVFTPVPARAAQVHTVAAQPAKHVDLNSTMKVFDQ